MVITPLVIIRPEPFGFVDVVVQSAPPGGSLDREFPTHAEALRYADGLCQQHGWFLDDQIEPADVGRP